MRPAETTVAQLAASLLDPASRRPLNGGGGGALLSVPGLVHASYLGPPDCVVAYHPDMPYLELLQALEQYEEGEATPSGAARGPLRFWLPCFSCGHPDSKSQVRSTERGGDGRLAVLPDSALSAAVAEASCTTHCPAGVECEQYIIPWG